MFHVAVAAALGVGVVVFAVVVVVVTHLSCLCCLPCLSHVSCLSCLSCHHVCPVRHVCHFCPFCHILSVLSVLPVMSCSSVRTSVQASARRESGGAKAPRRWVAIPNLHLQLLFMMLELQMQPFVLAVWLPRLSFYEIYYDFGMCTTLLKTTDDEL